MDERKEALRKILKEINGNFQEEQKIIKRCRERNAEYISNFLDAGGWVHCGYETLKEMFKENGDLFSFGESWFRTQLSVHHYEKLLNIPLGTYSFKDLEGLRYQFIKPVKIGRRLEDEKQVTYVEEGLACNLEKAEIVRERWQCVVKYYNKSLPSPNEIYEACKILHKTTVKQSLSSATIYKRQMEETEARVENIVAEAQKLKARQSAIRSEERQDARSAIETIQVKSRTEIEGYKREIMQLRGTIAQLEEDNRKLRARLREGNKQVVVKLSI